MCVCVCSFGLGAVKAAAFRGQLLVLGVRSGSRGFSPKSRFEGISCVRRGKLLEPQLL